ncbi:MAG TPA: FHA domain-containing protein [Verrucomicrobiae bacterium]|jgi:predicted component of type VI protein secretion system
MPKLVFIGEHFAGRVYELLVEKTTIGRAGHNTLTIHDNSVSSNHCEILVNGPEVIVHDLGSANGTFVDDVRVNKQCQVKSGHVIRFGSVEARLELGPETWDDSASEETAVFAMGRIMDDQRRALKNPKPVDVSATIESSPESVAGDHTVMFTKPAPPPEALPPFQPSADSPSEPRKGKRLFIGVVVLIVVGLAILIWYLVRVGGSK